MNQVQKLDFSKEQLELIKSQIAPDATPDELKLFLYQAKRTGLDPLTRQIYCIHRNVKTMNGWAKKMTIQTSIDGFRVIAERTGNYGGQSEPLFTEKDGKLESCKISVFRFNNGVRYEAAVGVAFWSEYVQTDKEGKAFGLWAKMPHTMLSKVAEALALRKAYPQDLSGIYTSDEMNQSDIPAYIKTHENIEDIELAIELCTTKSELLNLYTINKDLTDSSEELRLQFKTKQSTL